MYQREVSCSFRSKAHVFLFSAFIFAITANHSLFPYSSIPHSIFASLPPHYQFILEKCRTYLVLNKVLRNDIPVRIDAGVLISAEKVNDDFLLNPTTLISSDSTGSSLDDALYFDSVLRFFGSIYPTR